MTNEQITIGMTNQWHFYVVTNTTTYTNAAFVTFIPDTLSIPRMGVFTASQANATRPEADIDVYVSTSSGLTNLDPAVINGAATNYFASLTGPTPNVSATVMPGTTYQMASLGRGGSETVVDTNSQPNEVYYIGVKSEDQMASEYGFIPIFSATPFSQINPNGSQTVNGVPVPANIPDGTPAHPGSVYVFGVALYPMDVRRVVVTDQIWHENFGDLIGTLTLNGGHPDVLNNNDSLGSTIGSVPFVYDDSGQGDIAGSRLSHGPGNLNGFMGQQGAGVWRLTEVDNSWTKTGVVENVTLLIEPHLAKNNGTFFEVIAPCGWYPDYIDVPSGATNLIITVTNLTTSPQIEYLYEKFGGTPTTNSYDQKVVINTGTPPTNSISIPSPLVGRYYYGVYVPCSDTAGQSNSITWKYSLTGAAQPVFTSTGPVPIVDDAVTYAYITNSAISSTFASVDVGLRVNHPRISDLVFHLISPTGTRVLLVENRGGANTNGAGLTVTNSIYTNQPPSNYIATNYTYLLFTENTNLTTTPIKFAPPPFVGTNLSTNIIISDFESSGMVVTDIFTIPVPPYTTYTNTYTEPANYTEPTNVDGWTLSTNGTAIVTAEVNTGSGGYHGTNDIWIPGSFTLTRVLPTRVGCQYTFSFAYQAGNFCPIEYCPTSTNPPLTVTIPGVITTNINAFSSTWKIFSVTFTPSTAGTPVTIAGSNPGGSYYYYLDYFTLLEIKNDLFYLPEQPMDPLAGQNAQGVWTLEIQDARAGASLNAQLVSWQLRFNPVGSVGGLLGSVGSTPNKTISAGNIVYYQVNVPVTAVSAANSLVSANGPLNVWFNNSTLPAAGGLPGDCLLLGSTIGGVSILSANGAAPNIVPGRIYWLGVQNMNSFNVNYGLGVDFETTNYITMPFFAVSTPGGGAQLQWYPSSQDARYQVEWTTSLLSPIVWTTNAGIITYADLTTNWAFMFTDPDATNSPARFYRLIQLP